MADDGPGYGARPRHLGSVPPLGAVADGPDGAAGSDSAAGAGGDGSAAGPPPPTAAGLPPTPPPEDDAAAPLWHLTVTFAGPPTDPEHLRARLRDLVDEQPFLATVRYAADRAEVSYWDEADDIDDAAALGLRLWSEHRRSADLPDWHPVGLEVVDRDTLRARGQRLPAPSTAGDVRPY